MWEPQPSVPGCALGSSEPWGNGSAGTQGHAQPPLGADAVLLQQTGREQDTAL